MKLPRFVIAAVVFVGLVAVAPPANPQAYQGWYKSLSYLDSSGTEVGGFVVGCPVSAGGSQPSASWGVVTANKVVLDRGLCDPVYQVAQLYAWPSCSARLYLDESRNPAAYWMWVADCPGWDDGGHLGP